VTSEDRQKRYGHPIINFTLTALRWTSRLQARGKLRKGEYVDLEDVPWMMVDVKAARESWLHDDDNPLDACGYIRTYERIDEWLTDHNYQGGIAGLRGAPIHTLYKILEIALEEHYATLD